MLKERRNVGFSLCMKGFLPYRCGILGHQDRECRKIHKGCLRMRVNFNLVLGCVQLLQKLHKEKEALASPNLVRMIRRMLKSTSIKECYAIFFYHLKKQLYYLYHTILQFHPHQKTLFFYFFNKILFFNLSLLYLFHHHFFSDSKGNIFLGF